MSVPRLSVSGSLRLTAWLDDVCSADGWAATPPGMRGVLNDAPSIHSLDAPLAGASVARWCAGHRVETAEGVFGIRVGWTGGPGPAPTGL